jgi:CNP1-like family
MKIKYLAYVALVTELALCATASTAQPAFNTGNGTDNPDWVEEAPPPPPALATDHLIPIAMPPYVSIKVGVDPDSIVVGGDGVVRYVIVMTNATGNTNAAYEGLRCATDEVKTYARLSASGSWSLQVSPVWKSVGDNMPSHHAQAFARQGGCQNKLATSKREIVDALKAGLRPTLSKRAY